MEAETLPHYSEAGGELGEHKGGGIGGGVTKEPRGKKMKKGGGKILKKKKKIRGVEKASVRGPQTKNFKLSKPNACSS